MSPKILIVDDEAAPAHADPADARRARGRGRRAADGLNGEEALATIESVKPNLVFLDVMMPKLSGFDVCERAKQELGLTRRLHRAAHRQGTGVRSPARARKWAPTST